MYKFWVEKYKKYIGIYRKSLVLRQLVGGGRGDNFYKFLQGKKLNIMRILIGKSRFYEVFECEKIKKLFIVNIGRRRGRRRCGVGNRAARMLRRRSPTP